MVLPLSHFSYYLGLGHVREEIALESQTILPGEVQQSEHKVRRTHENHVFEAGVLLLNEKICEI